MMSKNINKQGKNIVGKGEIARINKQFLLFPQFFQELLVVDASNWVSME